MNEYKKVNCGNVQLSIPHGWSFEQKKGIDTSIWQIVTIEKDTILIEYGKFLNNFNEVVEVRSLKRKLEYDSVGFKYPKSMIFSENAEIDQAQGLYLNEYFYYDTICGKKAKVAFPKIYKRGRCLLYIPKIDNKGNQFNIHAKNVSEDTQKHIRNIFKTIIILP